MALKFIASALGTAFLLFFWGAVVYAGLLRTFFPRHFAAIARPSTDTRLWAVALEKVLQGIVLTVMYGMAVHAASSPVLAGLAFGCAIGVLIEVTWFFGVWTSFKVDAVGPAVTCSLGFARFVAAGALIGAIHG